MWYYDKMASKLRMLLNVEISARPLMFMFTRTSKEPQWRSEAETCYTSSTYRVTKLHFTSSHPTLPVLLIIRVTKSHFTTLSMSLNGPRLIRLIQVLNLLLRKSLALDFDSLINSLRAAESNDGT